jgi:RES domain-containing protein
VSLEGFPRKTLRADRVVYRIHRAARDAWWFSSEGASRFDPVGVEGVGACYLAEQPLGAWVEVFRKTMLIAETDIGCRTLLATTLGRSLRLADLTSRRALSFGVTASLGADEHYERSQAFAVEAVGAGFDGIRYLVRHDPSQRLYGIALFGPDGAPASGGGDWPVDDDGPIHEELVAAAGSAFGYRVLPTP